MNISFTATPTPANVTVTLSLGRGNDATGRDLREFGSLVAQAQKGRFGEADLARLRESVTESGSPGVQQLFGLFEQSFRGDWFGPQDLGRFATSLLEGDVFNTSGAAGRDSMEFGGLVAQAQQGRFGKEDMDRLRASVTEIGEPGVERMFDLFEQSFKGDWFGPQDLGRFAASLLQEGSLNPAPAAVSVTFDVPSPPLLASVKLLSN
jgi:hypothetical protein